MFSYLVSGLNHDVADGSRTRRLFDAFSAEFRAGELTVLTGPSGCGKTSLLSILALFERPVACSLCYDGKELAGLSDVERAEFRRRELGLVFQTSRLIPTLTVREHLALSAHLRALPVDSLDYGLQLLERLGLVGRVDALPAELSGGEKQRLALAQILLAKPRLVLADEPTAALDSANARIVQQVLLETAGTSIVLVVTHDPAMIDAADVVCSITPLRQSVSAHPN